MDKNVLDGLRAEEADLTEQLQATSIFRQLEAVRQSISVLEQAYGKSDPQQAFLLKNRLTPKTDEEIKKPNLDYVHTGKSLRGAHPNSMTTKVVGVAFKLFRDSGKRHQSGEVIKLLVAEAIIPDKSKKYQSQVASILSHYPLFDNKYDKYGVGYGLREWSDAPVDEQIAPTGRPSSRPYLSEADKEQPQAERLTIVR